MEDGNFINFEAGRKALSQYHISFLKKFYETELSQIENLLNQAFSSKNWIELKGVLLVLKETSGFIGAIECKDHTEALLNSITEPKIIEENVKYCFSQLIGHLLDLSVFLRQYFNKKNKKKLEEKFNENNFSDSDQSKVIITKKLTPPITRIREIENTDFYEDEVKYERVCQQWYCRLF